MCVDYKTTEDFLFSSIFPINSKQCVLTAKKHMYAVDGCIMVVGDGIASSYITGNCTRFYLQRIKFRLSVFEGAVVSVSEIFENISGHSFKSVSDIFRLMGVRAHSDNLTAHLSVKL